MKKVHVNLRPIITNLNLPTVLKTAILPGDSIESLFVVTQIGEIFYLRNEMINVFLDIRNRILSLGGSRGGYDERGLLGLAFHPNFYNNGLFYLHYSLTGTQGPGALESFMPNPCVLRSLSHKWTNRENQYDHIDTVEEWILPSNGSPEKRRTLLNLKRPFFNHNGVNSLNFSPETGNLVLTTGDGGSGYDPFNLSQDIMEVAGKIIEIDISVDTLVLNPPAVSRFEELPPSIYKTLTVISKGVRNITGISYQRFQNQYIKYIGNVGQDLVESIYSFTYYKSIPVAEIVQASLQELEPNQDDLINLGWRGWEGNFPTTIIKGCTTNPDLDEKRIAYFSEAIHTSTSRLQPLTCYYHMDTRPEKFQGSALTGVQPYMGNGIPDLTGCIVFTDFGMSQESQMAARGVLAFTNIKIDCRENDFNIIETDYNFGSGSAYFTCLGTNNDQTKLYLGVYDSANVSNLNQGTVFEII